MIVVLIAHFWKAHVLIDKKHHAGDQVGEIIGWQLSDFELRT